MSNPTIEDRAPTLREFFATDVFSVKAVVVLAALLAIRTILGLPSFTIFIGPGFKLITFAYVTDALAAMFYGPIAAVVFGFAGDFLGFLSSGGIGGLYFPGFAVSEIVTCFMFACFFFRRKITLPRVIITWMLNLAVVLLGLNSLWLIIMYGMSAGEVFAIARIVTNTVQMPLHIAILYLLLTRIRRLDKYLY
jgi:ECF transporter S component (folate family)